MGHARFFRISCVASLAVAVALSSRLAHAESASELAGYPGSTLPTVVPLRGRQHNLTLAGTIGSPLSPYRGVIGGAQLSYYAQPWRVLDIGFFVGGGVPMLAFAAAMVRPRFEVERFAMGLQLEGGYLFAGALTQFAVKVARVVWLHAAAGVRYRIGYLGTFVPVAFGGQFSVGCKLDLVAQVETHIEPTAPATSSVFGTLGFSWRLGGEMSGT